MVLPAVLTGSVPAYGVVAGAEVPDGAYAFVVHVAVGETGAGKGCTGALIDPQWIVTAASCFADDGPPAAGRTSLPTAVTIGRADLSGTAGLVRHAARLVPHPDRDMMLVKLDQPTEVVPVKIAVSAPAAKDVLQLAGYGRTATDWVPNRLHVAKFSIAGIDNGLINVVGTSPEQPGLCKGDAGGPAFREVAGSVELVAIHHASWQGGCLGSSETRRDATETRLDDIAAWIHSYVPGALAQDSRDDATLIYAYASGAVGPFTFTTGANGAFTARGGYKSADAAYNSSQLKVFRGDFNGDDIIDQAVLNGATNGALTLDTFLAGPDGTYSAVVRSWTSTGFGAYSRMLMTSGDYNGDGRTDIAGFYNYADKSIGLFTWLARSDGGFATPTRSWFAAANPVWGEIARMKIFSGDFNRDGRSDIGSFYGYSDGSVGLLTWSATAAGGFGSPVRGWYAPPTPSWGDIDRMTVTAGDFNGDGFGDVAGFYGYPSGDLAMLTFTAKAAGGFNTAFSSWKSTTTSWGSWSQTRFTAGDFNGDGRDDLAALYGYADGSLGLFTLTANASGGFAAPVRAWSSTTFGSYARVRFAEDRG